MIDALIIGISLGCVYGLVGIGFSLIYRTTGVLSFTQGAFVMLAGMTASWLAYSVGLPTPLAIAIGVGIATLAGMVLALLVVLPLWKRQASPFIVILGTFMFLVICENLVLNLLGSEPRSLSEITPGLNIEILGQSIPSQAVWVVLATILISALLFLMLNRTNLGLIMRACAADRTTSRLLNISPTRVALMAFALTAFIGGLAGILIAPIQFTAYSVAHAYNIKGFLAAAVGGLGDVRGALVGGLAVGLLEAFVGRYISTTYLTVILLGVLVAVLLFRPYGLISTANPQAAGQR